jgi:hypothetical protein
MPLTESQARPLTRLEPEQQVQAWLTAVETAPDGKVTAAHVESVVRQTLGEPEPEIVVCPTCDRPMLKTMLDRVTTPRKSVRGLAGLPQSRGKGVDLACKAIAVLKEIPLNDGLREAAFDRVLAWIEHNGQKNKRGAHA